jgi:lysophospholipase L1-like esterase
VRRFGAALAALTTAVVLLPSSAATGAAAGTWCGDRSDLAILGASSETGYGTTGYSSPDDGYTRTRYGWTRRLTETLHAEWGTNSTNYAHNGALVTDYYPGGRWDDTTTAVADIAATQPDLVIIDLGGNEYVNSIDPATFNTQLRQLVTDIRSARSGVDVLLLTYPQFDWASDYPWAAYADVIREVAVAQHAAMLDLRQHIDSSDTDRAGLWHSDGAHLNDAGQSVVSAAVLSWFIAVC